MNITMKNHLKYLEQLSPARPESVSARAAERNAGLYPDQTDNDALDTVLGDKTIQARQARIVLTATIVSEFSVSSADGYRHLAGKRTRVMGSRRSRPEKSGKIRLRITSAIGWLLIQISNPPSRPLTRSDGRPATTDEQAWSGTLLIEKRRSI